MKSLLQLIGGLITLLIAFRIEDATGLHWLIVMPSCLAIYSGLFIAVEWLLRNRRKE